MHHPPRRPSKPLGPSVARGVCIADEPSVLGPQGEAVERHQVRSDHVGDAPTLEESCYVGSHLDAGANLAQLGGGLEYGDFQGPLAVNAYGDGARQAADACADDANMLESRFGL